MTFDQKQLADDLVSGHYLRKNQSDFKMKQWILFTPDHRSIRYVTPGTVRKFMNQLKNSKGRFILSRSDVRRMHKSSYLKKSYLKNLKDERKKK